LLFGLATYGFLDGSGGLLLGGTFCAFGDGSGGGRPHVGYEGRREPEAERETTDAFEGVGETARLKWLARRGCGWASSSGFLPPGLLAMGLEVVEFRLIVRCREANVELKSLEDEPIGPETDRLLDTTESLLEQRFGMGTGSAL